MDEKSRKKIADKNKKQFLINEEKFKTESKNTALWDTIRHDYHKNRILQKNK